MKKNNPLVIVLLIVVVAIIFYIIYDHIPASSARDNYLGNLVATLLGVAIGIPIALEINRLQEKKEQNKISLEKKYRKERILNLLKKELELNRQFISYLVKNQTENPKILILDELKNDLWVAFSDGGDLQWIDDIELLDYLSTAYYYIRTLLPLEDSFIIPSIEGEQFRKAALLRPQALDAVKKAITEINRNLGENK